MAQLGSVFDARSVSPQGDRAPVPEGEYRVVLNASEIKETNDKNGKFIACQFKIVDGPLTGQTVFQNINIQHQNETAQRIGQERLSALCWVTGKVQITDTAQLHGVVLRIKVTITNAADGKKYNEITAFLADNGQSASDLAKQGGGPAVGAAPAWAAPQQQPTPQPAPVPQGPPPVHFAQPAPPQNVVQMPPQQYTPPSGVPQQQQLAPTQVAPAPQYAPPPQQFAQPAPAPQPAPPVGVPQGVPGLPPWMTAGQPAPAQA